MTRPARLIAVVGTHTEVGKTWVSRQLLAQARNHGQRVAARKPVQSFSPGDETTDAQLLAAATAEASDAVCPPHRSYPVAMAPPMAADLLGRPRILMNDLLAEIAWAPDTDLGLVETVGGVRSPLAHDGDSLDLLRRLAPDTVLLVADAGLGTVNAVRLSLQSLAPTPAVVFLNRFDGSNPLHRLNQQWLRERDGVLAYTRVDDLRV
ncbi:MAG: ATP-dependent dethiobiotin synthetase BioD [Burkholderiaceae bacterium]